MKKRVIFLFLALFLLFLSGCTQTAQKQTEQNATATLTLKYFDKDGATILDKKIEVKKGTNAFEAMKENVPMDYQMYSTGAFVKSIAGIEPPENHYMSLYINEEYANEGISSYTINEDTKIEWKTELIQEDW